MHNINKNQAKQGEAALSLWDKVLELLGLPQLQPVPIKNFENRQRNNDLPNRPGAKLWS